MEKIKIIYAFDNELQFDLAKKSIQSSTRRNSCDDISFVLMFNQDVDCDKVNGFIKTLPKYDFEKVEFDAKFMGGIFRHMPGMFFWLFAPFRVDGDRFLQIDNDTLINTSIIELFHKYESELENNLIIGAKTNIRHNSKVKEKLETLNLKSNKLNYSNYVNYGVLLFNAKLYREMITETRLVDYIEEKTDIGYKNRMYEADQEWMFEFFSDKTSFLDNAFNARIHKRHTIKRALKLNNFILHYNFYYTENNKRKKFDFHRFMYDEDLTFDQKAKLLSSSFKGGFHSIFISRRNRRKYSEKITKIFNKATTKEGKGHE